MKNIIKNIQPTDVVEIVSNNKFENFSCRLSSKNLFDNDSTLNYKLHSLAAVPDNLTIPSGIW